METIVCTQTFDSDMDDLVRLCKTLKARESWPGAQPSAEQPGLLYYQLSMKLQAATMTDCDVEERITSEEQTADGVVIETTQRVTWPDGHADGFTEYRFVAGTPNTLQFTYRYEPPGKSLVKPKNLPGFRQGLEMVANKYLSRLVKQAANAN